MAYQEGQQLGNYRIIQELVRGDFADVYLGKHIHLGTQVVIKVFNKYISIDFFLREARTFVELKHPHILRVLDYAVENGTPFLVTDYAPNGSLRWYHRRGSVLPIATVVSYVGQVADALQYLHDHKFIYRYVWPQNMFLRRNDEVLLDIPTRIVIGETFIGTPPPYMAPEQRYGNPSPASDQYALGAVAYEWLSGDIPSTMSFPLHPLPLPPLREKVPTIPPSVEAIILKALATDPQQRFPNVKEFANALEQASKFAQSTFTAQPPSVSLKEQTPPMAPSIDKCPYCGAETRPGDNFCLNCGNRLLPATSTATPITPASNDRAVVESTATLDKVENPARFIIRDDRGDVLQEYRLEKSETVIGRAPASDIVLAKDKLTSRHHAVVRYEHGDYVLCDERSANGTFVNGQQLEELVPRVLKDGDHVGIGEHELIFRTSSGVENLPTISVPSDAVGATGAKEVTYRTREDEQMTAASGKDFDTRSMNSDVASVGVPPSSVPASQPPQPVAVSPTAESAAATPGEAAPMPRIPQTPSGSSFASSEAPAVSDSGVTFNHLISLTQPTLREDTSSQDTTKVLSLFAIARTALEEDDRAFIRKVYSVEAGISQSKPEGFEGEPFKLPLRSSIRFLFLDILLHTSSNIELISHWQRRLRYDSHNPEPQLVAFKFKVKAPGSCSLAIDFYYERRWLRTIHFEFDAVEQSQLTAISSEG